MDGFREKVRESERVRGVAPNHRSVSGCSRRERGTDAEEAKIYPGCHKAKVCQEHGGLGANYDARKRVNEEENCGEVLDTHADEALCNGNRVLRDELFKGHEEPCLDGDATGDGRVAVPR
jgi:hypothetical protein